MKQLLKDVKFGHSFQATCHKSVAVSFLLMMNAGNTLHWTTHGPRLQRSQEIHGHLRVPQPTTQPGNHHESHGYGGGVTTTKDGKEFESLAAMPYSSDGICVAGIDTNSIFITGLGWDYDMSYMYYKDTGEWVTLPNMPTGRDSMGCGVVRDGSGRAQVVVVGGAKYEHLNTVEIFNVEEEKWSTGTKLL